MTRRDPIAGSATEPKKASWHRLASALGIDFQPGEAAPALLLFMAFFLFVTFQYATKSIRQSTFISSLGATKLPYVYMFVAFCSYPFLQGYSRLADRVPRHHLIAGTCTLIGATMALFWWLFQFSWPWVSVVFYVWVSIVYVMTVSQFWSFSNHVFDPRQAKRLFGFIGAGGLLGGIAGGQVARVVTEFVGTRYTLLVASGILVGVVVLIYIVHSLEPQQGSEARPGSAGLDKMRKAKGGFEAIAGSRHLQAITAIMVLTVVVAQIVDLQFNWAVEQATSNQDQRTAFFGNFYSIMNISAFAFQLVFTSRIHRVLGVGFAMRVLPVTMGIGTIALFIAAGFKEVVLKSASLILKIGENGLRYSLDQATRELLFLPIPSNARLKAKAYIDVLVQRGAKGLAALLLLPVTFGVISVVQAGWISLGLIALWLSVTVWAFKEYVHSFQQGLKKGTMDVGDSINLSDIKTLELLVRSLGSSDERQVMHSLDLLVEHGRESLVPPLLLYHDSARIRLYTLGILERAGRSDSTDLIERRLGDEDAEVRAEAARVLASLHGRDVCELMLPRLHFGDSGVRAGAIACVANHGDPEMQTEAAEALRTLLSDASSATRRDAVKAIGAIHDPMFQEHLVNLLYDPDPEVVREAVQAVRRRVARDGYNPIYVSTLR